MTQTLVKGGNTMLAAGGELEALLVDVVWRSPQLECDLSALVCGADRKVLDDDHFVFFNQPTTPERSVFLLASKDLQHSQIAIDVTALPLSAERIVVSLSTVVDGATLAGVRGLQAEIVEPSGGLTVASYEVGEITQESCLIVCEVYRHAGNWKVRAVGQGYSSGLAGLGRDYGVDL